MIEYIFNLFLQYGPIGLFLLAFVSNAIPYSTIPYLVIIAPLIARFRGLDLIEAVISLALGATTGKLVVFLLGKSLYRIPRIRTYLSGASNFFRKHSRSVFFTLFLVAALPIPDDVFYIPIGSSGYNIIYYFIAVLLGKIVIALLTAIYGITIMYVLEGVIGFDPVIALPAMIILTAIILLALGKIDWLRIEEVYESRGALSAIACLAKMIIHSVILAPILKLISSLRKYFLRR